MTQKGGGKKIRSLLASTLLVFGLIFVVSLFVKYKSNVNAYSNTPLTPTNLTATDNSDKTSITLNWHDNATNEDSYKIERSSDIVNSDFVEIANLLPDSSTYTDNTNFTTSKRYWYRVKAFNNIISSEYSLISTPTRIETKDFLNGNGDFAKSNYSRILGDPPHIEIPTENLTIANGWTAALDASHMSNNIYKIVNSTNFEGDGQNFLETDKSYQYMGFNNTLGNPINIQLYASTESNPAFLDETFSPGDSFTFQLDKIIPSNIRPNEASVTIGMFYDVQSGEVQQPRKMTIDLSNGTVNDVSLTLDVPNVTSVRPFIQLYSNSAPAGGIPGVITTGAHLWVKKSGDTAYKTEEVPATKDRDIKINDFFSYDEYTPASLIGKNADEVITGGDNYSYFYYLKRMNPNLKIYIYQGGGDVGDTPESSLGPFTMDYVVANHSDWLYPNLDDPIIVDSGKNNTYAQDYANAGYNNRYWVKEANTTYQNEWASRIISLIHQTGADGVFIDTANVLLPENTHGLERKKWEVQQFLHGVIPQIKAAGIASVMNDALGTLDGTVNWGGDITEMYFNPTWTPNPSLPEFAEYSNNTADNTPDIFFREFSFIHNGFGFNSEYWLKCVNDAKILAAWNANLPPDKVKRIQYNIKQDNNNTDHPPYDSNGKSGWIPFSLASFLISNNDFISMGINYSGANTTYANAKVDYSITQKLGIPDGEDTAINGNQYFRMRKYKVDAEGSFGGLVLVNANTSGSFEYATPIDYFDENNNTITAGTILTLPPNTGRIFLNKNDQTSNNINLNLSLQTCLPLETCVPLATGKNYSTTNAVLTIYQPGTTTVVFQKDDISTDISGHANFDIPSLADGNYDYKIKVSGYLIKAVKNTAFTNPLSLDFGTLLAGDLTGRNQILMADFMKFAEKYSQDVNKAPPDFNQDGIVTMPDFMIFANNYSKTGE